MASGPAATVPTGFQEYTGFEDASVPAVNNFGVAPQYPVEEENDDAKTDDLDDEETDTDIDLSMPTKFVEWTEEPGIAIFDFGCWKNVSATVFVRFCNPSYVGIFVV